VVWRRAPRGETYILNCKNKINITKNSTGRNVAGFVSSASGTLLIKNCVNYGNITGSNNCGGLVGWVNNVNVTIENSCNKGNITNYLGQHAGGLVGRDDSVGEINSIILKDSYNEGTIVGTSFVGGLVGRIYNNILINNCYNIGDVYSEQRTRWSYIGGLIGRVWETAIDCTILNSYNTGDLIPVEGEYNVTSGGLIAQTTAATTNIINSYNLGNVSATGGAAGGICGAVYDYYGTAPSININNCYSSGQIVGSTMCGIIQVPQATIPYDIENIYYLDTSANMGVYHKATETDLENLLHDNATRLSDAQMKAKTFVDDLNANIQDIDTEYDLRKWKLNSGGYPVFE